MANVRIDENGIPKAPVYETTSPKPHRSGVTAVDAADPTDASQGVDCSGYQYCRFDVEVTGTDIASLDLQVLFWNSRQGIWFGGAQRRLTAPGKYALEAETRGATVFLKVVAFSGTSFTLNADYSLS
jgi:hypothetical protein